MKRNLLLLTALFIVLTGAAKNVTENPDDTPQPIVTFVKVKHEPSWYARQATLWRRATESNPRSETAWLNLYHATRYQILFTEGQEDYSPLADIWKAAHKALPDSYIDYVLTYFHAKFLGVRDIMPNADDNTREQILQNMVKAIRMKPDEVDLYPDYVACLMSTDDTELMNDILHRWYDSGTYSANLLNYAYNVMVGLEPRAIIFTNGDTDTFSKLILQGGKGLFTDVQVICAPMLYSPFYLRTVCDRLGIDPIEPLSGTHTQADYDQWLDNTELQIIRSTGRPAYYCATAERLPSFADSLYSEGLVSRYSTRRYDNLAVKQRNYEKRYLLDYLSETFVPETYEAAAYSLNLNYIPCFKSLLDWYKEHDKTRHKELYSLMMTILRRTENITDEKRQSYYDEINR